MTDEDCQNVELLGWLYQFYITDKKADAEVKKTKKGGLKSDEQAAATQLFHLLLKATSLCFALQLEPFAKRFYPVHHNVPPFALFRQTTLLFFPYYNRIWHRLSDSVDVPAGGWALWAARGRLI